MSFGTTIGAAQHSALVAPQCPTVYRTYDATDFAAVWSALRSANGTAKQSAQRATFEPAQRSAKLTAFGDAIDSALEPAKHTALKPA